MTFMSSLAANPSGSGIFGQPGGGDDSLTLVNQLKDREMRDFKDKAAFMSDLSLKQDRLRRMYDTASMNADNPNHGQAQSGEQTGPQNITGMNTVMAKDPNMLTGYEKAELGIKQQGLNLDSQRIAQQGRLGQQALDIKNKQEELNQQTRDRQHQQKIDDANNKVKIAEERLAQNGQTIENLKAYRDAVEVRKNIELATKDLQHERDKKQLQDNFNVTHNQMQQKIDAYKQYLDQNGLQETETSDAAGNKITKIVKKGDRTNQIDPENPLDMPVKK